MRAVLWLLVVAAAVSASRPGALVKAKAAVEQLILVVPDGSAPATE